MGNKRSIIIVNKKSDNSVDGVLLFDKRLVILTMPVIENMLSNAKDDALDVGKFFAMTLRLG